MTLLGQKVGYILKMCNIAINILARVSTKCSKYRKCSWLPCWHIQISVTHLVQQFVETCKWRQLSKCNNLYDNELVDNALYRLVEGCNVTSIWAPILRWRVNVRYFLSNFENSDSTLFVNLTKKTVPMFICDISSIWHSCQFGNVYFIFEHTSFPSKPMSSMDFYRTAQCMLSTGLALKLTTMLCVARWSALNVPSFIFVCYWYIHIDDYRLKSTWSRKRICSCVS